MNSDVQTGAAYELEIRLFGQGELRLEGLPIRRLRTRKGLWLLALLILKYPRPVERTWLVDSLWPDALPEQAFSSLRKCLNDLRNVLGPQAYRLSAPTPRSLALNLDGVLCDVLEFDARVSRGDSVSLTEAVGMYVGRLLESCSEDWLTLPREERRSAYVAAREALAEIALGAGDAAAAATHLIAVISLDPMRESAHRALMRAHAMAGNYAAVTRTYRELRIYLRSELNAEPDSETVALYGEIRAGAERRTSEHSECFVSTPSDLPHRIRVSGERIPHPVTELVGRAADVNTVRSQIAASRIVTLTGTGGIGKTRLAIEVAHTLADSYPDGAWFVDLASAVSPDRLVHAVANSTGTREQPGRSILESLQDNLRDKRMLIVLDNCEHLIDESARVCRALLLACPELRILATSRQQLGVTGELLWSVPSLSIPDEREIRYSSASHRSGSRTLHKDRHTQLMEHDSIRLFVTRARLAHPDFTITPQNAAHIARVCRRLDGIPLAIELAASRVRALSPEEIAARLDDRFRLLTGGGRDVLPRQKTLQAALDWSYNLLDEEERALLRRLSVFSSGWMLDAAEAVCGGAPQCDQALGPAASFAIDEVPDVLQVLVSLIDKSIVGVDELPDGTRRFRLHETMRHYAQDRLLEFDEVGSARDRHMRYFLRYAESCAEMMWGDRRAEGLDRLTQEHDNIRSAMQCMPSVDAQIRISMALNAFWRLRCHWTEGREYLDRVLDRATELEASMRAKVLIAAGDLARRQGDYASAISMSDQCVQIYSEPRNDQALSRMYRVRGVIAYDLGDLGTAREMYESSLELCTALDDREGMCDTKVNLSNLAQVQGNYAEAARLNSECLTTYEQMGDTYRIGVVLNNMGNNAFNQGDFEGARVYCERSLAIRRQLGNRIGVATCLAHLGNIATEQGDYQTAREHMERSLDIAREIGDVQHIAYCLHNLGNTAFRLNDSGLSAEFHKESLLVLWKLRDRKTTATGLEALASIAASRLQFEQAAVLWGAADAERRSIGVPMVQYDRANHEAQIAGIRGSYGEGEFGVAWARGAALSLDEAVEFALKD